MDAHIGRKYLEAMQGWRNSKEGKDNTFVRDFSPVIDRASETPPKQQRCEKVDFPGCIPEIDTT